MTNPATVITDHLDTWSGAIKAKSSAGRGSGKNQEFYGIKKLRELILDLAVRGLLVPQDAKDEPASELLKKVTAQEARLVKAGTIGKRKPRPEIKEGEKPFALPPSWVWIRLAEAGHDWGQKNPDAAFTYIDVGSINKEQGLVFDPSVLSADQAPSRARKIVKEGTVIYSTVRPYLLNIAVVSESFDPEPIASTAFAIVHPFEGILARFVYRYLRSPSFIDYVESCQTGIAYPAINDKQFFSGVLPLPPLAEQHRIVAKVDELMALCDQLEQQQEDSVRTHETLVQTLLGALTAASEPDQFAQAWQQIASHFDTLFTTESSIDQLKQTILQLAVKGKLVEQQTNTEDAKLDFPKWKGRSNANSGDFLPSNWMNIPLGEIGEWRGGGTPSKNTSAYWDGSIPWVCPKDMKRPLVSDSILQITETALEETSVKSIPPNSLLMVVRGMILARDFPVAISASPVTINQDMKGLIPAYSNVVNYLALVLRAFRPRVLAMVERSSHGTCKLQTETIQSLTIPIPPLAEQRRIVAKVDELMALCDRLKTSVRTAQVTQLNLADSLVEAVIH